MSWCSSVHQTETVHVVFILFSLLKRRVLVAQPVDSGKQESFVLEYDCNVVREVVGDDVSPLREIWLDSVITMG